MAEESDAPCGALRDGDVEGAASEIVDEEDAVAPALPHDAHHSGDRLLHKRDLADACLLSGCQRGVLLHLIERGGDGDHGPGLRDVPNVLGEVAEENPQDLGGALLRRHGQADCRKFDRRACSYQALKQHGSAVWASRGVIVGVPAVEAVAPAVDEYRGRRDVVLDGALVDCDVPCRRRSRLRCWWCRGRYRRSFSF